VKQRFVVVKVFRAETSETEIKLDKLLRPGGSLAKDGPGKHYVELASDAFIVSGPNGEHFCKVIEPLGHDLKQVLEVAFEKRSDLNEPDAWKGRVLEGDSWSGKNAKRLCWQILSGLDYLHSQGIAHRDIQPANVCVALEYDLSSLSENEIQGTVWYPEKQEEGEEEEPSGDSEDEEQWKTIEAGDEFAEPHSVEWNKANFWKSRNSITLVRRKDGKPLAPDEIQYIVAETPLDDESQPELTDKSRAVLIDLGFACAFNECEQRPLYNLSDFQPPEHLIGLPSTYKADIFSAGLLFWEIVMLRRLVEALFRRDDPERIYQKNRLMRDLANRLGMQNFPHKPKIIRSTSFLSTNSPSLQPRSTH
jgi:serine/threonine protein kinase